MITGIIKVALANALNKLYDIEITSAELIIQKTRMEFEGDFTFVVFPFLKVSRKSPEATAEEIGQYLLDNIKEISGFNVVKGFLNLKLDDKLWISFILDNHRDNNFGHNDLGSGKKVILEFSSPNTNKPLHLGHIRNNLLGYSVSEILTASGFDVVKVNLVNDRGIHICKSMLAWRKWGGGETPSSSGLKGDHLVGKYYVLFNQHYIEEIKDLVDDGMPEDEAKNNAPLINEARGLLQEWERGNDEVRELWSKMNGWVYDGFDVTYEKLGIRFDKIYHESETYLLGRAIVDEGLEKGVYNRHDDGSVWCDLSEEKLNEKLLLRSDGTSVYITQDLGTAQLRYDEFHPDKLVYVVGNEQNHHFAVLRSLLKKVGRPWYDSIYHMSYGMVELPDGKMKSREGTVVDADDLVDEMIKTAENTTRELGKIDEFSEEETGALFYTIGMGALKYFILKVDPKKSMMFNPKESIDFNGNTGPFIQYTYARIRSLIRKASLAEIDMNSFESSGFVIPDKERKLIRQIFDFREAVMESSREMNPAVIANYVYELVREYNQFYQAFPIIKEEDRNQASFRLLLSSFSALIIKNSMQLLGIPVPERM